MFEYFFYIDQLVGRQRIRLHDANTTTSLPQLSIFKIEDGVLTLVNLF